MPLNNHEARFVSVQGWFFTVIFLTLFASSSQAVESLGRLSVSDIFLEPSFKTTEGRKAGFLLERSMVGVLWEQDQVFSGKATLGTKDLLNQTVYARSASAAVDRSTLGLVEGYAQANTSYGQFRMGLQPIWFGKEGEQTEYENVFPNSLFYADGWFARRDLGASYLISNDSFTSFIAGHNGEGGEDLDDRIWLTARVAWKGIIGSEWGLSGSTARYVASGAVNETRVRMGNAFAGFAIYGVSLNAEATVATFSQNDIMTRELIAWHVDVTHPITDLMGLQARYDFLDPNNFVVGDSKREITVGLNFRSRYKTSSFYILGTKVLEESNEYPNDVLKIVWRITPWLVN